MTYTIQLLNYPQRLVIIRSKGCDRTESRRRGETMSDVIKLTICATGSKQVGHVGFMQTRERSHLTSGR